jgi:hypothetical protein
MEEFLTHNTNIGGLNPTTHNTYYGRNLRISVIRLAKDKTL